MKWVHPNFLFAFAVLLIPLLVHLFHFRKYKTVYFSSLTFIKNIEQEQKNPRKIKHFIILALRLLAFSALVLAFAQPYFSDGNAKNDSSKIIGLYLDNSYSMSRIGENGELLNQGKQIIEAYVKKAPVNSRFILFTNELSGKEKQILNPAKLLDKLDKIDYSPIIRNQKEIIQFWNDATSVNTGENTLNDLVYLSDFQQINFTNEHQKLTGKSILFPVKIKPVQDGNLYIDTCWFDTPVQRLGGQQRIGIRIKNSEAGDLNNVVVNVRIGKMNRDLFASLKNNEADTVYLDYFNQVAGEIKGSIQVNDKQMTRDDAFYFSYNVKSSSAVLLINGEDASKNVRIVFDQDEFYKTTEIDENHFEQVNFEDFDLIVLNGLNQIPSALTVNLTEHAENGGTLFLIPGANASFGGWNQLLNKIHLPVMNGIEQVGLSIQKINLDDSFFQGVFERKPAKLGLPLVSKSYQLENNAQTTAASLLNYQNGSPFLVKGSGKLAVYMLATALDPTFSSFTTNQLFSTVLLRTASLSQKQAPLFITLGSDAFYPISGNINSDQPVHLKNENSDFIPLVFNRNNKNFISVKGEEALNILHPGIYAIVNQGKSIGKIAINVSRKESVTASASTNFVVKSFAQNGFQVKELQDGSSWNGAGILEGANQQTAWRWLVGIALLAVLGEMLIVLFYKR